jgi:HD domain
LRAEEVQRTRLARFAPHVLVTTLLLVAFPLAVAYRLSFAPFEWGLIPTAVACTLVSVGLGRVGAAMWQRHPGSRDVVFDDLLLWGYARRLWNGRRVIHHAERLAKSLSTEDQLKTLQKLAKALESGDPYTHGHSDRVARHAYMIARAMKLPRLQRERVRLAAALHDVGKLNTPRDILTKPGRLTDEEYTTVKLHPGDGADMVAALNDDQLTAMVRHHHERMDGTGYPERLDGSQIPIGARIISVADTFDAITSKRAYRDPKAHKAAIDILRKEAGTQLDGEVVNAFIEYYTGRREIRLWLSITSSIPRLFNAAADGVRRAAVNAAVVGSTSVAIIGGAAVLHGAPLSQPAGPQVTSGSGGAVLTEGGATTSDITAQTDGASGDNSQTRRVRTVDPVTGEIVFEEVDTNAPTGSGDTSESGSSNTSGPDAPSSGGGNDGPGQPGTSEPDPAPAEPGTSEPEPAPAEPAPAEPAPAPAQPAPQEPAPAPPPPPPPPAPEPQPEPEPDSGGGGGGGGGGLIGGLLDGLIGGLL